VLSRLPNSHRPPSHPPAPPIVPKVRPYLKRTCGAPLAGAFRESRVLPASQRPR